MSDFLFARPSTIDGIMRIVDLFGVAQDFNDSKTEEIADSRAIRADVNAIKSDFVAAYKSAVASYA